METRVSRSQVRRLRQRRRLPVVLLMLVIIVAAAALLILWGVSAHKDRLSVGQSGQGQSESGDDQSGGQAAQSGLGISDLVTVAGKFGALPVVDVARPVELGSMKVARIIEGEGRRIAESDPVLTQVYRFSGEDGSPVGDPEFLIGHATADEMGEEFTDILVGESEGTRLLVVRPQDNNPCELAVVDILPMTAAGEEVTGADSPLDVAMGDEGPRVKHKKKAPARLTVQTLIRGEGPQVQLGDQILAHFLLSGWSDDVVLISSWGEGLPVARELDDMWPGLIDALVDQRVGSRLAVTIPPDQANGEDTIIAVIDILGTVHAADQ